MKKKIIIFIIFYKIDVLEFKCKNIEIVHSIKK